MRRSDTDQTAYVRSKSRIFRERGAWYYHTREGIRGPFGAERAAANDLALYVETMSYVERNELSLPLSVDLSDIVFVDVTVPAWADVA